jgi:hypothetical protein
MSKIVVIGGTGLIPSRPVAMLGSQIEEQR